MLNCNLKNKYNNVNLYIYLFKILYTAYCIIIYKIFDVLISSKDFDKQSKIIT